MSPVGLQAALQRIGGLQDERVLVGFDTSDDAGVYRMDAETALVQTVDFITPPVDDPVAFGAIAAANSLSDVYAMGGRPLTALNLVCFPEGDLEPEVLFGILEGGARKVAEAGAVIIGGHSVRDDEPKYGLSVTGVVHPDRVWRNVGARAGDALLLTKALGTGVLFNANRKEPLPAEEYEALVASASRLNARAAAVLSEFEVHACTDITGFGLAGHACEMAREGRFEIRMAALPVLPGAREAYARGVTTSSNRKNRAMVEGGVWVDPRISPIDQELVFDPQTSGGLLVAVPEAQAEAALRRLRVEGEAAARVGRVRELRDDECPGVDILGD